MLAKTDKIYAKGGSTDDREFLLQTHPEMQKMKLEKVMKSAMEKEIMKDQIFCKSQESLTVEQWVDLLCKDNNAAKECPVLNQIKPDDWVRIFQENAPLAQRFCPQSCYDSLSDEQREIVNNAICGLVPRKKKKQSVSADTPCRDELNVNTKRKIKTIQKNIWHNTKRF